MLKAKLEFENEKIKLQYQEIKNQTIELPLIPEFKK